MPQSSRGMIRLGISLVLFFFPVITLAQSNAAPPSTSSASQVAGFARIVWEGNPKISRYRLQLARNEQFSDIVFDKLVQGREYKVTEIAPGKYFWRVAPAASETGAYSKPLPVTVSVDVTTDPPKLPTASVLSPPNDIGWRTATGFIEEPVPARLRAGKSPDIVGCNTYGMVYAIDGGNGTALWSARYRPGAKKGEPTNSDGSASFVPVLIEAKDKPTSVLVAFDGGVRALDGATGRELWRTALTGEAIVGTALMAENDGTVSLAVFDQSQLLWFLKGDSGQMLSQTKLDGAIVGSPIPFSFKNERGVLMALNNGKLDARNLAGGNMLAIKLDAAITTAPVLVLAPQGQLVMLGTEAGLVALDAANLTPLWRVATVGDAPRGTLMPTDLEGDGSNEIVMITRRGRTVVVNVGTGKIKWFTEGATDAGKATIADVNGDGVADVIVPGGTVFALGFSGKDGALVWRADESAPGNAATDTSASRVLVAAQFGIDGGALLVGGDTARTGLRAVGLTAGALK